MSNKLVELARRARTSLGESLHFGLCAELADCVEKLEAKNDKLEQQLAEFEHGLGYEQGKKDGWEACETCHGIVDGKHMEAESLRQQLADRDEQISDLTISSDTYFAERNSARDVWRRASKDRDELRQQLASCDAEIERLNEQVAELERAKEYKYVEQVLRPIKILIALAQSAETLAENSEETENSSGKIALGMPSDFETLSENLDLLDELPDDKPGYTLSGAAKAAWALRDLLGENYD